MNNFTNIWPLIFYFKQGWWMGIPVSFWGNNVILFGQEKTFSHTYYNIEEYKGITLAGSPKEDSLLVLVQLVYLLFVLKLACCIFMEMIIQVNRSTTSSANKCQLNIVLAYKIDLIFEFVELLFEVIIMHFFCIFLSFLD